ncbi:hypothetical protein OEZ86_009557 [Tetradesmus obliquus]|uniref:Uncharacterized protein n=1 Tax=Tetradesmus obliquus TaxID=3088 RepID=A0ABY8UMJ3_TETOB|nr:hypothetical protein OEZ85_001003 [Tetradesmus obliquus]WIA43023.1 hypothetical protein OEZ86_009557 [Tetradesmus obliquus]
MDMHMDPVTPGGIPAAEDGQIEQQQSEPQHEKEQQLSEQQQQAELTDTIRTGLDAMSGRHQDIHAKIDELSAVLLRFLETTKLSFMQLIDSYRKDVDGFCDTVVASNSQEADETLKAICRLQRAQRLVEGLGLNVLHPDAQQAGMQL